MKSKITRLTCKPYVKYLVIKVDMFQSELIDEMNFDPNDKENIATFIAKYNEYDNLYIVRIEM